MDKEYNKQLIEKYPFLMPHNRFTDKVSKEYDYSYTELDEMPEGWRKTFGEMMCEDIKQALIKENHLEQYRIMQIKEKFGALRWYDNGRSEEIFHIVEKYSRISEFICCKCGKLGKMYDIRGWLSPYCDECAMQILNNCNKYGDNITLDDCVSTQGVFNPIIKIFKYIDGKDVVTELDCSDIWKRINEKL